MTVQTIFPVILAVPGKVHRMKGRQRVVFLSRWARRALVLSAEATGVRMPPEPPKDPDGVPLPAGGFFWSLSHKPDYVCAVVAPAPVGIDVERIGNCSPRLFSKLAADSEWDMAGERSPEIFFRFWTAKEAVLKATGDGFKGLSRCRIQRIDDATHLTVSYLERQWPVQQWTFDGHIAAVAGTGCDIHWRRCDPD